MLNRLLEFLGFKKKKMFSSGTGIFVVPKEWNSVSISVHGGGGGVAGGSSSHQGGTVYSCSNGQGGSSGNSPVKSGVVKVTELPVGRKEPLSVNTDGKLVVQYDPLISLYDLEKDYVLKALNFFGGNKTQAASALGITIKTLYNKLHEYGEFENYAVNSKRTKEHVRD